MREFHIQLHSVKDVQEFVAIATTRPFTVTLRDPNNKINAKSFMEMFCLDLTKPLRVVAECDEAEFEQLRKDAARFLVN